MKLKNINYNIQSENSLFQLYLNLVNLKSLYRQGWLYAGVSADECETVAEHSFSTSILAWTLALEHFPELNSDKILKLGLIHDLGEIHTGDITPHDNISSDIKFDRELSSLKKTFGSLKLFETIEPLWLEYENESSPEAVFVKQIDKIEMIMQALVYQKSSEIDPSDFLGSIDQIKNEKLKDLVITIINEQASLNKKDKN